MEQNFKRPHITNASTTPFIGVYDAFSASVASRRYSTLFLSGFGFAASHYGMPDVGFITWTDMVAYVQRIQTVLPEVHLLVDIDDGYGDPAVACHVARVLDRMGVFGVVLEDQQRPRRCGHVAGKQILPLDRYLDKLDQVLRSRERLFVIARTDASDRDDIVRRAVAFEAAGADAVLADGIQDLDVLRELRSAVNCPIAFNQLAGGKSPMCDRAELAALGVSIVIYSTPCLFAAQRAMEVALDDLELTKGSLGAALCRDSVLAECNDVLYANLRAGDTPMRNSDVQSRISGAA